MSPHLIIRRGWSWYRSTFDYCMQSYTTFKDICGIKIKPSYFRKASKRTPALILEFKSPFENYRQVSRILMDTHIPTFIHKFAVMNSELLISLLVDFNFSLYAFLETVRLVDFQKCVFVCFVKISTNFLQYLTISFILYVSESVFV